VPRRPGRSPWAGAATLISLVANIMENENAAAAVPAGTDIGEMRIIPSVEIFYPPDYPGNEGAIVESLIFGSGQRLPLTKDHGVMIRNRGKERFWRHLRDVWSLCNLTIWQYVPLKSNSHFTRCAASSVPDNYPGIYALVDQQRIIGDSHWPDPWSVIVYEALALAAAALALSVAAFRVSS
jgi:hypothetical protein